MRRPAFWLSCAFAGGILACASCKAKPAIPAALCALAAGAAGVHIRGERAASSASLAAAFFAGVCVCALHEGRLDRSDLKVVFGDRPVYLTVRGTMTRTPAWERQPDERGKPRWKGAGELRIASAETARGWIGLSERVRAVLVTEGKCALGCGDEVELRGILRRISEATNPGQFDGRAFWLRRGLQYSYTVTGGSRITILSRGRSLRFHRCVDAARRRLRQGIEAGMPEGREKNLIVAMILGYRENLDEETARSFRLTNTYHIVAISGLNVGFVYLMVRATLRAARVPRRAAAILSIPVIAAHAVITGAEIPVMRATVMFAAFLIGPLLLVRSDMVNSLGVAALILLSCNPLQLFDLGFQLSFAAVISILFLTRPLADPMFALLPCGPLPGQLIVTRGERVRWFMGRNLITLCATSAAAWIGLAPMIAHEFHLVTALGLLGNIVVIPAGFAIVGLGFSGALVSLVCMPLARMVNLANWLAAGLMCAAIGACSRVPGAWCYIRSPGPVGILIYYGFAGAGLAVVRGAARGRWKAVLISAMVLLPLLPAAFTRAPPVLRITFLDVGQGDSACVEFPNDEILLVDAGPGAPAEAGGRIVVPFLKSRGRSRIETVLLSHAHDDHYGGFDAVFREFTVGRAVTGEGVGGVRPHLPTLLPRRSGGGVIGVSAGDLLAEGYGARITVLNPRGGPRPATQAGGNNGSVALMVTFGRTRALLCGDMEGEAEEALCRSGVSLKADVLKVGHHGGASSCTEEFLRRVSPRWAVVSAGAGNRFGHPSPGTLARLREAGAAVLRTDLHGAVTVTSDGEGWEVETFR